MSHLTMSVKNGASFPAQENIIVSVMKKSEISFSVSKYLFGNSAMNMVCQRIRLGISVTDSFCTKYGLLIALKPLLLLYLWVSPVRILAPYLSKHIDVKTETFQKGCFCRACRGIKKRPGLLKPVNCYVMERNYSRIP